MKLVFAIGRCDKKTRRLVFLKTWRAPIVGPFTLKALVGK